MVKSDPPQPARLLEAAHYCRNFARYAWHRFTRDNCPETAASLCFNSLLALVPLMAVILSVVAAFPQLFIADFSTNVQDFVFSNFVPAVGEKVRQSLNGFVADASKLTGPGAAFLIITALLLMSNIEKALNRIWRVTTPRRAVNRFLMYWAALTVSPLLVGISLAMTSYLLSLPLISDAATQFGFKGLLLSVMPFLVEALAFTLAYLIVPNRPVPVRHALLGALVAAVFFELAKRGFGWYVTAFPTYNKIYGAVAAFPVFLIWVYLSWLVILFGASVAAGMGSFSAEQGALGWPRRMRFLLLLRLAGHLAEAQHRGVAYTIHQLVALEPAATEDQVADLIQKLRQQDMAACGDDERWLLTRNPASLTLAELYRCDEFPWPDEWVAIPHKSPKPWYQALENTLAATSKGGMHHLQTSLHEAMGTEQGSPNPA